MSYFRFFASKYNAKKWENATKFDFVVSSSFYFFEFSRQKSENTTEKVRQYDTFYVSFFRLLFVMSSHFRIVVFWLFRIVVFLFFLIVVFSLLFFGIFAFRLRMRRLITNMIGGANDNDWIGERMRLYKAKMRQCDNTKKWKCQEKQIYDTCNATIRHIFASKMWRSENTKIRQSQTLSCFRIVVFWGEKAKLRHGINQPP